MKKLFSLLLFIPLSACNGPMSNRADSNYIILTNDSRIEILQEIIVPAGKTRVFMQKGQIVGGFNHYHPNCNVEVRRIDSSSAQSIMPGTYQITGKNEFSEEVVKVIPPKPIKLAVVGQMSLASMSNGGPSDIYRSIHFYLSGKDENVMRLTCRGAMGLPSEAELPNKAEIRESLGDLITIVF